MTGHVTKALTMPLALESHEVQRAWPFVWFTKGGQACYDGRIGARAHRWHRLTLSAHELATLFRLRDASVLADV